MSDLYDYSLYIDKVSGELLRKVNTKNTSKCYRIYGTQIIHRCDGFAMERRWGFDQHVLAAVAHSSGGFLYARPLYLRKLK